eukprot:gene12102-8326_t
MNVVIAAAEAVRDGEVIQTDVLLDALQAAAQARHNRLLFEKVEGDTFVIGPIRGHGSDFAHYLLTVVLTNNEVSNIVFLGNYIDGAHQALSVLYLVALLILHSGKQVVPLIGRHEHLYPMRPENFGSLQRELELRAINAGVTLDAYEPVVKQFFVSLSVGCIVDDLFFCVAGGPASNFPYIADLNSSAASSHEAVQEFILNSPMDEDEEHMSEGYAFIPSPDEVAFRFTFNAACNFISRNKLASLVVGMEYYTDRPEYDSFAKPNHYKLSVFFPGYTLGRIHPEKKLPAVTSVFSAPKFCGVNWNNACILQLFRRRVVIRELEAYPGRKLILPGSQDHCFSWAQPLLEKAVVSIAHQLIFHQGVKETSKPLVDTEEHEDEQLAVAKMRRLCQLLKENDLPFPVERMMTKWSLLYTLDNNNNNKALH